MVYIEFVQGIALTLMRAWKNASKIERELNINHKMIDRRRLDAYSLPPASLANLKQRLVTKWSLIEVSELNVLCDSMPQR